MFRVLLICSDGDCAEIFEAYGPLEELEALACDCGCSLELIEVSESHETRFEAAGFELSPIA